MILLFVLVKLALQFLAIQEYGYFRDEFYYLACARHLAWGYPDQPPLSIAVLALVRSLFGDSLLVLRAIPAILGAGTVYLTGRLTRELGGGNRAVFIACLAVVAAPMIIGTNHVYSMNSFDLFLWPAAAYALLRCLRDPSPAKWTLLGVVIGLALLNKISALWLGMGLAVGFLATPERRRLATYGPWLAAGVAALLFLPYVLWNASHAWPTLEFMRNAMREKMVRVTPVGFLLNQILSMNPASFPIWLVGLVSLLRGPEPRRRVLGWAFLSVALILILPGKSKPEYLAPAYMMLFAAGGVAIERWSSQARFGWPVGAFAIGLLAFGVIALPMALPVLAPDAFVRYSRALGVSPQHSEKYDSGDLPQHYADMFGWDEMAKGVALAFAALPAKDRARCVIIAQNYGEAGALELLGAPYGLPRVICGHNSYGFWGTGDWDGGVAVVLGGGESYYRKHFEEVTRVGTIACDRCMEYERAIPIFIVRRVRGDVAAYWATERFLL
jgi:hypothetical protein